MTRRLSMFIRLMEFQEGLAEALIGLDLDTFKVRVGREMPHEPMSSVLELTMRDGRLADRLFIVDREISRDTTVSSIGFGQDDTIICDLPVEHEHSLYLSVIACKSEDSDTDRVKRIRKTFDAVTQPFRMRLSRPTWARNIVHGGPVTVYRDIGYSDGAQTWERDGGELMQAGVGNVRFTTHGPEQVAKDGPAAGPA